MIPWRFALGVSGWRVSRAHLVADAVLSPEECEELITQQGVLRPSFEEGGRLMLYLLYIIMGCYWDIIGI